MKFGVKAHYKDVEFLKTLWPLVVEIHTEARDIEDPRHIMKAFGVWADRTILHVPTNLDRPGGQVQLVDLASQDSGIRAESIGLVVESCRVASELGSRFVIIHPGGVIRDDCRRKISNSRFSLQQEMLVNDLSMNLQLSLVELSADIEEFYSPEKILIENMPYFYWMKNGEKWYPQILVEAGEMDDFIGKCGGICLDICHAFLARPGGGYEVIEEFLDRFGNKIRHVHISDARAPDGEGLQIGKGEMGFTRIATALRSKTDYENLTGIPEIKDGHLKRGAGFRVALDLLRTMF